VKITNFGTDKDGEWNGKPINISEKWASDDLATTLLEIRTDLKGGHACENRLTNIKREEPDPSLFEVPSGCKINPTPAEMPFQTITEGEPLPKLPK
jgi:hypothetical protein